MSYQTPALVQSNNADVDTNPANISLNNTPTLGDVIFAVIGVRDTNVTASVSSISQSGVTWTQQKAYDFPSAYSIAIEVWAGVVTSSSASTSISVTLGGTPDECWVMALEFSGILTASFLDQAAENFNTGSSAPDTGTTSTTTQTYELWIGGFTDQTGPISSPSNSFTLYGGSSATYGWGYCAAAYYVSTTTGTADCTASTSSSNSWIGCIITVKAASANPLTYVRHWLW